MEKNRIDIFKDLCQKIEFDLQPEFCDWLEKNGFFTAPASTKYHSAYPGGLFDHSFAVTKRLIKLSTDNHLQWKRKESPFIIGMFHDLCKCDLYRITPDSYDRIDSDGTYVMSPCINPKYEYNPDTLLKGHGSKSIMLLSQFITLTEEEMLCIRYHMGAYEKEEWAEFDLAAKKYPNVLFTHMADMLASKIDETGE